MSKNILKIIQLSLIMIFISCGRGNSSKNIFRALSKTTDKNKTQTLFSKIDEISLNNKLLSIDSIEYSSKYIKYKVSFYISDTLNYLQIFRTNVPYVLKFDKEKYSIWYVESNFYTDTSLINLYDKKTMVFKDSIYNGYEFSSRIIN